MARANAREAAKQRYATQGVRPPPKPAAAPQPKPSEDSLPMDERTPYQELCERLAAIQPPLQEHWVLVAAKRLGWIQQSTQRLADMDPNALGVLLVRWSDLVKAARQEEAGVPQAA